MMLSTKQLAYQLCILFACTTTISPAIFATHHKTAGSLPDSCTNIKHPDTNINSKNLSVAARKTLTNMLRKYPHITITECQPIWLDEQVDFDKQVSNNASPNKALLFFDKGINPQLVNSGGICIKTSDDSMTKVTELNRNYFTAKKPIILQEGSILVGIPLNDNNSLADGYFVGINEQYSHTSQQATFSITGRDVVITGFTTNPIINNRMWQNTHSSNFMHGKYIHTEITEVDQLEFSDNNVANSPVLILYKNQFIINNETPITILHTGHALPKSYLYSLNHNQFISCNSSEHLPESAIKFKYVHSHTSNKSLNKKTKTIEIVNNNFNGMYKYNLMSLTLPESTKALIKNNNYYTISKIHNTQYQTLSALHINGIVNYRNNQPAYLKVINNHFANTDYSISISGKTKLQLIRNQLLGDIDVIYLNDESNTTLLTSSTDNTYNQHLEYPPCTNLEQNSVHGSFTFVNGDQCPPLQLKSTTPSSLQLLKTTNVRTQHSFNSTKQISPSPTPTNSSNIISEELITTKEIDTNLDNTTVLMNINAKALASKQEDTNQNKNDKGIGGMAITGIAVGSAIIVSAIAGYIYFIAKRKSTTKRNFHTYEKTKSLLNRNNNVYQVTTTTDPLLKTISNDNFVSVY